MNDTLSVGKKLVELCREGKAHEAIETLYSHHIVSVEAGAAGNMPARMEGIDAVKGKAAWWGQNHEVHSAKVEGPFPNGDRFIVRFTYEITPKVGPMAGKRITMDEGALYTVKDGKISHEEFFYSTGA